MALSPTSSQSGQGSFAISRLPQEDNTGEKFTIYASTAGASPGAGVKILDADSTTDKFVKTLNKAQSIILSGEPHPEASFDISDETRKWFMKLDPSATASLTVDNTAQKNIQSFTFEFKEPWPIIFSSDHEILLLTFGALPEVGGDDRGARIKPPGLDAEGEMLTCGVDFQRTLEIKGLVVRDLINSAGARSMLNFLPSDIQNIEVKLATPGYDDKPKRNAMWFVASSSLQTTIRLQFQLVSFDKLQQLFGSALKGFTLESAEAIYRKQTVFGLTEAGSKPVSSGQVLFVIECSVQAETPGAGKVTMAAGVEFAASGINLTLTFTSSDPLDDTLKWLAWITGDDNVVDFVTAMLNKEENGQNILAKFTVRKLSVGLDTNDKQKPRLASFGLDVEVEANFGHGKETNPVVFLLSYNWNYFAGGLGTLAGQLWNGM